MSEQSGTLFTNEEYEEHATAIRRNVLSFARRLCTLASLTQGDERAEDLTQDAILRAREVCTKEYSEELRQAKYAKNTELAKVAETDEELRTLLSFARWDTMPAVYRSITTLAKEYVRRAVYSLARMDERVSSYDTNPASATANEQRAHAYLIKQAMQEGRQNAERWAERQDAFTILRDFTPRQQTIVRMVASGITMADIGAKLHVAEGTVKATLSQVRAKANKTTSGIFNPSSPKAPRSNRIDARQLGVIA